MWGQNIHYLIVILEEWLDDRLLCGTLSKSFIQFSSMSVYTRNFKMNNNKTITNSIRNSTELMMTKNCQSRVAHHKWAHIVHGLDHTDWQILWGAYRCSSKVMHDKPQCVCAYGFEKLNPLITHLTQNAASSRFPILSTSWPYKECNQIN